MSASELEALLREVEQAPPYRRAAFRSDVERFGAQAIGPMIQWLADEQLEGFAGLVLEGVARRGHKDATLNELRSAYRAFGGDRAYLARLGKRIASLSDSIALPPEVAVWVGAINRTRGRRGQPYLTNDEIDRLRADWQRVSQAPDLYRNHCWNCRAPVLEGQHARCSCRWLTCYCGACMSPNHGYCAVGAERFPDAGWPAASITGSE